MIRRFVILPERIRQQLQDIRLQSIVDLNVRGDDQSADFINCVVFGRGAEFAENYLHQGTKIAVTGRIQTGSYTNKEGNRVYTTDVVVEEQEFAESKAAAANYNGNRDGYQQAPSRPEPTQAAGDGFMNIPDAIEEELPFN